MDAQFNICHSIVIYVQIETLLHELGEPENLKVTYMKKIDLHIHTKSSRQDRDFVFSQEKLEQYVTDAELDCIAITNHNLFDLSQFKTIESSLDILVLPGIEVDVERCHILVLSNGQNLELFSEQCSEVEESWIANQNPLSYERFTDIFPDLSQYILIPHYLKDPKITPEVVEKFGRHIYCGEVSSPKKFMSCQNDDAMLTPLFFSDCRVSEELNPLPTKQTYVDCEDLSFGGLRELLRDKRKVSLSAIDENRFFQIFPDGQKLSTGLNVILGDRSSGKSHTLQRICDWFGEENTRYIRQFDLVARNEAEDERKFRDFLSERTSLFSNDYLADLQRAVEDMLDIDLKSDTDSVERYVSSLLEYARETSRHDAYSRAKIYSEDSHTKKDLRGLTKLISSTKQLVSNVEYRSVIDRHIDHSNLKELYIDLMKTYSVQEELNGKKEWVNSIIHDVKLKLQRKSSATNVADVDLLRVAFNRKAVTKFEELVRVARKPKTPHRKRKGGFEIVAQVGPFTAARELKDLSRSTRAFSAAYQSYDAPYLFLNELRKIGDPVVAADFSKFLVKIDYKILNRDGFPASGGERSEFFLLDRIEGASGADILLIDEPESSFDNHFLREEVNEIIKEISRTMPVVIVTHNATVGASIHADYLIYTRKEMIGTDFKWRLYSGSPTNKNLKSTDGATLPTRDILLGNLEAGAEAYEQRSATYENLRN